MNTETITAIKEALTPIAEKIGQGAGFSWEVVLRQQYVEAYIGLASAVGGLAIAIVAIIAARFFYKRHLEDKWAMYDFWMGIVLVIGGATSGIMIPTGLYTFITRILNPEYYAIQFFIGLVN